MKSILFVHYGRGLGGAPKALRHIIQACCKANYNCHVACLPCKDVITYFEEAGAKTIIVDSLPSYINSTTKSLAIESKEYHEKRSFASHYESYWRGILDRHGPFDLVFLNSMVLCELNKPTKESGCRVIQVVRETAQAGQSLEIMKQLFSPADAVLFISEYDRQLFNLHNMNCRVIPDSVDSTLYKCNNERKREIRRKYNIGDNERVFLFTGGTGYIKGGEFLVETISKLSTNTPVILLFAGYNQNHGLKAGIKKVFSYFSHHDRYVPQRIEKKIEAINKAGNVNIRMIGFQKAIENCYQMADICLVPYKVPHQAMPIFEAGFSGIPCIVSDYECFKYEVKDGYNGFLVPYGQSDKWNEKMKQLIEDKYLCDQMGNHNYKMASERHENNSTTPKIINLIEEVIGIVS